MVKTGKICPPSDGGIRRKMIRANLLPLLLMWCILILCSAITVSSSARQQTQFFLQNSVQIACEQLQGLVDTMTTCSNSAMLSLNQETMLMEEPEEKNSLARYNAVSVQLFLVNHVYSSVESLFFTDTAGQIYTTGSALGNGPSEEFFLQHNALLDAASEQTVFFGIELPDTAPYSGPQMLAGKRIINIPDGKTLGYLYMTISGDRLCAMLEELKYTENSALLLCSDDGVVLCAEDKDQIGRALSPRSRDPWSWNGLQVNYRRKLPELGLELVYTVPVLELYAGTLRLVLMLLILGILGVGLSVIVAQRLAEKLTAPILQLTQDVRQVEQGDLSLRTKVETDDEVGVLARGFNQMLEKVHRLLEAVTLEQQEKAQKEIALLQNQIKPHFLYNTLNTIYTLCLMGQADRAADATKTLADYYRHNLSGGRNVLSLQEELLCVEKYLDIQRFTYQDRISVGILCSPEAADCPIPKMTLQPIVENAIVHGLKPQNGGSLLIQAGAEQGDLVIRVTDDGVGMEESRKNALWEQESPSGFGLKSVWERLRLYYGDGAAIDIASAAGCGTTVTITVPMNGGKEAQTYADPSGG